MHKTTLTVGTSTIRHYQQMHIFSSLSQDAAIIFYFHLIIKNAIPSKTGLYNQYFCTEQVESSNVLLLLLNSFFHQRSYIAVAFHTKIRQGHLNLSQC